MAMLFLFGIWALYLLIARKCLRMPKVGTRAGVRHGTEHWDTPHVEIPNAVPSEWVETYRMGNDA